MKVVVDVDAGIDDIVALMMLLGSAEVEVVAITTVSGNTSVYNVNANVLRLLQAADRLDIPVYGGCDATLLGKKSPGFSHHGRDGFGDNPNMLAVDQGLIKEQHAVPRLVELSKEFEGELTLLALGPLTNVAMALRIDPCFGSRLKNCMIMGGTSRNMGNMSASAEFNFFFDPEAAFVAINELRCPICIVGWEVCLETAWPWELFRDSFLTKDTRCVKLIKDAEWNFVNRVRNPSRTVMADAVAAAVLLRPEVALRRASLPGRVFLTGEARGSLQLDRRAGYKDPDETWTQLEVVEEIDGDAWRRLMRETTYCLP